ncbi:MAG: glycoside hydrolase family 88 protein [Spirochaetaceae bacterium]|jgi:unsaturated rhamnogalacturonyl hydrolase|nr:glycoside hydrolase family 88 protein [Spirochaetaceae bacterium]
MTGIGIDREKPLSERAARSVMGRYTREQVRWHYEHGLVLQSIFAVGERAGNEEYGCWVKTMYDAVISDDGVISGYREEEYNLDQINPGKTLFSLYKTFGEEKYRAAIERLYTQLTRQPRTKTNGFWHKKIYPWQMWLDGLYMQGPFYAQYTAEYGAAGNFDDLVHQFVLMESKARDDASGLLYHAWDEARAQVWADPRTGCSPHFWGRAMGWFCMALVDALDYIPPSRKEATEVLKAMARRMVAPILKYQDKQSGLWYQILDRGQSEKNYPESSVSAMFVYFLFKLLRTGVLTEDQSFVQDAALAGYAGLLAHQVSEDASGLHLRGICKVAGLGGNPYRDGSYEYYVNEPVAVDDFKGIGPFILASLEREALGF